MKTEVFTDPQAFLRAVQGKRGPAKARRAKGEGTGSRTSALDTLARHGYTFIGYDHATGVHYALRNLAERTEAADYDTLLDTLLARVR